MRGPGGCRSGCGRAQLGAGRRRAGPPRRPDDHRGRACTANFVFFDAANDVYLGQAAHCSSTSDNTSTDGCLAGTRPHGTPVEVDGASRPGTIVFSSWVAMQATGETDTNACRFNDIALIKLDPADYGSVNPSIPFWGGPTGTATATRFLSYGNSSLRLGVTALSPKEGASLGTAGGGWTHQVYTARPASRVTRAARSSTARGERSACSARSRSRRWPAPTASATCRA
ncbi:MAG: hypothetical protein ACXW08_10905 [Solirubrobacteraceae bacterium]